MKTDLGSIKSEIENYLHTQNFAVFHGFFRPNSKQSMALWDSHNHPDYREFLAAARAVGAKLIGLATLDFNKEMVAELRDKLEDSVMPLENRRRVERRIRDLGRYDGFTCSVTLFFDHDGRTFVYDLQAEWYEEFLDMNREVEAYLPLEEEDEDGEEDEDFDDDFLTRN